MGQEAKYSCDPEGGRSFDLLRVAIHLHFIPVVSLRLTTGQWLQPLSGLPQVKLRLASIFNSIWLLPV